MSPKNDEISNNLYCSYIDIVVKYVNGNDMNKEEVFSNV